MEEKSEYLKRAIFYDFVYEAVRDYFWIRYGKDTDMQRYRYEWLLLGLIRDLLAYYADRVHK